MPLRQVLRDISHAINNRVAVFWASSNFLRRKIPHTHDTDAALDDLDDAARDLRDQANRLERATRTTR